MNSAAGSSDREMSKIEDSISYKLNALKETWIGFLQVAANRASIKIIIDFLTKVSELLVKVLELPGANVAVIGGAAIGLGTLVQKAKEAASPLLTLSSIFKELFGKESPLSNVQNVEKGVIETVNKMKAAAQSGTSSSTTTPIYGASGQILTVVDTANTKANTSANFENATSNEAKTASEIKDSAAKRDNIAATEADNVVTKENTDVNNNNAKSLLSLIKTHWKASLGIAAVVTVLAALYKWYEYDTEYVDKLNEKTQDLLSTFKQQKAEIDSNIKSVQSVSDEYYQLASGVDSYGNNISLSNENFERYNEISNQIAETFPELVSGYTDTGDAILSCKDSVDALNQACKDESLSAYSDLLKSDSLSKTLEDIGIRINGRQGFFSTIKGTEQKKKDLEELQGYLDAYKDLIVNKKGFSLDGFNYNTIRDAQELAKEFDIDPDLLNYNTKDPNSVLSGIAVVEKGLNQAASDLKEDETQIVSDFNTCVNALLDSSNNLNGLDDTTVKNIKTYLSKFDIDDVNGVLDGASKEEAVKKVNEFVDEIVKTFSSGKNAKDARDALNKLMSLDLSQSSIAKSKEEIDKYIAILAKYLKEDPQELKVKLGVDTADAASNRNVAAGENLLDSSLPNANEWQRGELEELRRYTDQFTEAESQEWLKWANSVETSFKNVDAIIAAHKQYLKNQEVNGQSSFDLTSFSSTIESLDKINTAYQKVAENIKANKIGEEIVSDINDIEALREEFKDLSDTDLDFGSFGSGMEGFDEIERVLTSSSSSAAEMQSAFDQLGNTLVNAKMAANDYDEASQQLVSSQLQQAGATKESADAYVANAVAIHQAKEQVAEASGSVENATVAEILTLAQEGNVSTEVAAALLELAMEKVNTNSTTIMTSGDIDNLYKLMVQAGATTDQLNALAIAKANASDAEGFSKTGAGGMPSSAIENQKKQASKSASKTASDFYQDYKDKHKFNFSYTPPKSSSGGGGGGGGNSSDAKDEYVEEFEKQYEKLGELRDNDKIDEYEYLQYLRALYEKFFKDKEKYAEQYEKYEHEYLSGMKELYDNVFSYLSGQIDKQISKLNEQKSAATENLKSQKESAVNALKAEKEAAVNAIEAQIKAIKEQQKQIQKQIDAYQDEIDAINDANEARERELALQKALYDLDKLQNQRTNLVYSESQGMHYEADLSGIRDARESVQDAKDDIAIANLQKKIDLLEKEKDALDEQIDALEEQKQAIEDYYDDLISQTEEYWDNLIAESEAYYDQLVKQLQGQKDLITEWQDALENAKFNAIIKDLTGKDAHEIFGDFENFDTSKLEELKGLLGDLATQYVSLETTMNDDNTHVLDSFAEMNNLDLTKIPNYLEATSAGFDKLASCDFDVVKNGVEGIRTAFETLTDDKDAFATVGQHLSESFTSGFKDAIENEDVSPVCGAYGNALTQGFNAYFADSEHTAEVGRYVTEGIGKGMASDDAKSAIDDASSEIADYTVEKTRQDFQINSPSELLASEVGLYAGLGVAKGMPDSLDDPEFQSFLQQFVDGIAQKLHDAFAQMDTSNLLDLSSIFGVVEDTGEEGTSTANIFSQLLEDIQAFADAFANIDITNVVTQFTDLRDAVLDVSSAIGGTTGASESGEQSQSGTSGTSKQSKKSGAKGGNSNQQSSSGGSLTEAMQSFGDTATEVLGGGGEEGDEEEGSGVIGQFATLKTKVEDVTAAIGTEDDSGGDGKSGGKGKGKGKGKGEDSGTLIEALKSEQEVAFDEEKGLPAQNEQWSTLESNIQKCVDAVQRLIDKLTELEEFSLTVHFSGHSEGGGGAKADGTFASHASGSFPVTMHSYAKGSNVGLEHDQRALIGEVGYEGLVRQNRFSLIGKNGAEMMSLKKGDIIFSHSQTKELLKNGKIHSRGKAVGTHSYADGTPLKSALKFAGSDYSSTQLVALATKLTGVMDGISVGIDSIERRTTELANKVPNVTTNTANKTSNVTIGDIHVSGVQDVDSFAKAVKSYLPGKMLQELHKN